VTRTVLFVIISVAVGIFATVASLYFEVFYTKPGTGFVWQDGFPLPWRSFIGIPCGLAPYGAGVIVYAPCLSGGYNSYDWVAFAADVVFYLVITFGLLLVSTKYLSRKPAGAVSQ